MNMYTTEANRDKKIYMAAVDNIGIDNFVPPPTLEDKKAYDAYRKWVIDKTSEAEKDGRAIVFDYPFDLDY